MVSRINAARRPPRLRYMREPFDHLQVIWDKRLLPLQTYHSSRRRGEVHHVGSMPPNIVASNKVAALVMSAR